MSDRPPRILALESATRAVSVALLDGEELVLEESAPTDRPAAETLLPSIDRLLARAGSSLDAIDAFAVSIGPGSFTSLRIGVATIKGLAFGRACPVAPVSTLEVLALAAGLEDGPVVALLDARRDEVYAAVFAPPLSAGLDPPRSLLSEGVYNAAELAAQLPARCRLVGEGAEIVGDELRRRLGEGVTLADPGIVPRARGVGILAARLLRAGGGIDAKVLVPRYVRRAEAEVKRTGERFEPASRQS